MIRVFVTHQKDKLDQYFGPRATQRLQQIAQVRFNPEAHDLSTQELIAVAHDCDALIAYRQTPGPELLFSALPRLAAFMRCAVDIRTVDIEAANVHGVLVTQASAGYAAAVAEWVMAAMVNLARGISRYAYAYHRDRPLAAFMGRELRGSTMGVIGLGQIGQYVSDLALAFGMRVLVTTLPPFADNHAITLLDLPTLLAESDFVICLAPANAETESMMNAQAFAAMKPGAFFVNAARGELVDDDALLQALDSGHLGGCALDVGRAPDQMPAPKLARHPLVLASPHIAGLTLPAIEHQALETVEQLVSLIEGKIPIGSVNAASATRLRAWSSYT